MVFQMYFGHECYMSHDTWTIYCKRLVKHWFQAAKRRELLGPDLSWAELDQSQRTRILKEEAEAEPDFKSVEADEAGGLDLSATERATLRVAAPKKQAAGNSGLARRSSDASCREGKGSVLARACPSS